MGIILFVVVFVAISVCFLILLNKIEHFPHPTYDSRFTKGAVRGSMGWFTTMSMLEEKRIKLQRKNSKF